MTGQTAVLTAAVAAEPETGTKPSVRPILLLCVAIIVAIEVFVGRTGSALRLVPGSDIGAMLLLEDKIIRPNPNPAVVVFGTSRARGAFLPTELEAQLGLRRGQVLNLAMGGALPFDAVQLYLRNREVLRRARVMAVQVDAFQFTVGIAPTLRYRYLAGFRDRLAYPGVTRWNLLGDMVFSVNVARPVLYHYLKTWITTGRPPEPVDVDRYGRLALVYIGDDHDPRQFERESLKRWLDAFYTNFRYSPVFEDHLGRLIDLAHADGAKVYLVHMPTPPEYFAMLRAYDGDPHAMFRSRMETAFGGVADGIAFWELPSEVGLRERDYRDWAHLNTAGAIRWTAFFADWLKSAGAGAALREAARGRGDS